MKTDAKNERLNHDPVTTSLVKLAADYRQLQNEHQRRGLSSATRRRLERKMDVAAERYFRMCSHWVSKDGALNDWARYLRAGGRIPNYTQQGLPPPVFVGIDEYDSRVELRLHGDGYDITVNGSLERHERVPWHLDPDRGERFRVGHHLCREIFNTPPEALEALDLFWATPRAKPPWRWMPALFSDGVIDENFALTERGCRALRKGPTALRPRVAAVVYGVLVADRARARLFVLPCDSPVSPSYEPLTEIGQLSNPGARARDCALLSDSRPGLNRGGRHGPRHGVNDRREAQRVERTKRFAEEVALETQRQWRLHDVHQAVVAAGPKMLGHLRRALDDLDTSGPARPRRELDRDLTHLERAALHDSLAAATLVPPRFRLQRGVTTSGAPSVSRR